MFENLRFETERLILRPYQVGDLEDLYEIASDPIIFKYIAEPLATREFAKKVIDWSIDCMKKNTKEKIFKINMAIIHKSDNHFIGYCGLGPDDISPEEIEIYYAIKKEFWGRGLVTEAANEVLKFGFEILELNKIVTEIHPENVASIKIVEKFGMTFVRKQQGLNEHLKLYEGYETYEVRRADFKSIK